MHHTHHTHHFALDELGRQTLKICLDPDPRITGTDANRGGQLSAVSARAPSASKMPFPEQES
ncbi:hypothetical protein ASD81_18575 [Nocardioides sp. Root614]|nr:hypothetical protein ASD81_18575 [Nocardioides sp. Root614]KRA88060.1 hypothetical protein ASD84_18850 [Nocardioides sp. Root682]